jgi:hypothetical protein
VLNSQGREVARGAFSDGTRRLSQALGSAPGVATAEAAR